MGISQVAVVDLLFGQKWDWRFPLYMLSGLAQRPQARQGVEFPPW